MDDPFDDPAGYKVVALVDHDTLAGGNGRGGFREFNEEAVGRGKDDGGRSGVATPDLGGDVEGGADGDAEASALADGVVGVAGMLPDDVAGGGEEGAGGGVAYCVERPAPGRLELLFDDDEVVGLAAVLQEDVLAGDQVAGVDDHVAVGDPLLVHADAVALEGASRLALGRKDARLEG